MKLLLLLSPPNFSLSSTDVEHPVRSILNIMADQTTMNDDKPATAKDEIIQKLLLLLFAFSSPSVSFA